MDGNNTNKTLDSLMPHHKMGFKILNEVQLKNMFPTYENLFEKIDIHRANINNIEPDFFQQDYQYNLMYDNLFSILGKRGSGKTSAVFTLKRMIYERYEKYGDCVLPVIMPEMIPNSCDIMSWILAILDDVVTEIENKISSDRVNVNDNNFFNNCKFRKDNRLRLDYKKIQELYFAKGYNLQQEESFEAAIGSNGTQIQYSYQFSKNLVHFWSTLKESIKKTTNKKVGGEPLIYIVFDDMDLAPDKVIQMLSVIIKYLSHPNLIVIVTADEEQFNEVIENSLEQKLRNPLITVDNDVTSKWALGEQCDQYVFKTLIKKKKHLRQMADLYLGKVLPPSSRYYLNTFDSCEKKRNFIENVCETGFDKCSINLEKFLCDCIDDLKEKYDKNFLYYNNNKNNFITAYFLFWGNTSRQLANECILLKELIFTLKNVKTSDDPNLVVSELYQQIYHFLYNTIVTNITIDLTSEQIETLIDRVWYIKYNSYFLYVNYDYLNEYIKEKRIDTNEYSETHLELVTKLYVLFFFVENLLLAWKNTKQYLLIHQNWKDNYKTKNIIEFLDEITKGNLSLIPYEDQDNVSKLLYYYGWILEKPVFLQEFDSNNYIHVKTYIDAIGEKRKIPFDINDMFFKWNKEDTRWFKSMVEITFLAFNGMYSWTKQKLVNLIGRIIVSDFDPYVRKNFLRIEDIVYNTIIYNKPINDNLITDNFQMMIVENIHKIKREDITGGTNSKRGKRKRRIERTRTILSLDLIYSKMDEKLNFYNISSTDKGAYFLRYFYTYTKDSELKKFLYETIYMNHDDINLKELVERLRNKLYEIDRTYKKCRVINIHELSTAIINLKNNGFLIGKDILETDDIVSREVLEEINFQLESYISKPDKSFYKNLNLASNAWLTIKENLIFDVQDMEQAKLFIALWESLIYIQKYYTAEEVVELKNNITNAERNFYSDATLKNNFFGKFYTAMMAFTVKEPSNNDEKYLITSIREQIEFTGRAYFQNLKEY